MGTRPCGPSPDAHGFDGADERDFAGAASGPCESIIAEPGYGSIGLFVLNGISGGRWSSTAFSGCGTRSSPMASAMSRA
jgi:hypothetical protein